LTKFAESCILDFDYLALLSRQRFNTADSRELAQAVAFLFPFLAQVDTEVARSSYIRAIADQFAVDELNVRGDFSAWQSRQRSPYPDAPRSPYQGAPRSPYPGAEAVASSGAGKQGEGAQNAGAQNQAVVSLRGQRDTGQVSLLAAVFVNFLSNAEYFARVCEALTIEDFDDPDARDLYISLEEARRKDVSAFDDLLSLIQKEELRNFVREKAAQKEFSVRTDALIADSIKRMNIRKLERGSAVLVNKMRMAQNNRMDESVIKEMLEEKVEMDAELRRLKGV
jgi:DNA primase